MKLPENGSIAADVFGTQSPTGPQQTFYQAFKTIFGEQYNREVDGLLLGVPYSLLPPELADRRADITTLFGLIVDNEPDEANSLTQWAGYQQMMDRYGQPGDGTANALMVGGYTPLSMCSFARLANRMYGAVPYAVDINVTANEARHLPPHHAMRASGLALPFRDGSMNFVHTNQLLHLVRNHQDAEEPFATTLLTLFSEMTRVLAPGGQLLMIEKPRGWEKLRDDAVYAAEKAKFEGVIQGMLGYFGMSEVHVEDLATHPVKVDYLFDAAQNLTAHGLTSDPWTSAIYARK